MLEYRRLAFAAVAFAMIVAAYCDSGPRAEATSQQSPAVCEDTQPPEPLKPYDETLPFHAHLAEWLAEHPQLQQIECQSKQFIYRAKRQQSQLSVESLYKDGSRRHAEYLAQQEPTIGSGFRRHGVIRSLWPNGNSQSVEYYCHGLPVGFHQYFDDAGNLSHVVDYSGSDYEWRKRLLGHEVRAYYDGENRHWNGIQPSRQTGLFREAYAIEGGKAVRKAFATAQVFNPPWFPLDLSTTIAQWTNPGDQGLVTVGSRQLRLVNEDLEYLSFAEVYQRHKRGLPGLRPPAAFHTEILACPWIDEAMRLGVEDARFQMPPVAAIDEQTRKNSPEARFAACLNSPTADCLFEHALKNLRFDRGQMDGYAKSAILAGHPEWARKAANEVLGKTQGFTLPNAIFGPAAAYKAQAEFALGLRQEAEKSLDEAYQHAVSELGGTSSAHKIPAILAVTPVMARQLRVEETRRLYERAVVYEVATALIIPEALALDLIRQGRVDEAEKLEQEFFADSASDARIPAIKSGSDFKPVDDAKQHILAMIELAKVRVKRGDIATAREILGEIDKRIAGRQLEMGETAGLGLVYARLGDSRKVSQLTESPYFTDLQALADIAVTLCNRGQTSDGLQLLERLHLEKLTAAKVLIARAWVESACGKEEQARKTIAVARQDWKLGFPCCTGDLCNRVGERDLWREWQSRIDAGKTAACSRGEFMGGWSLFFQRLLDQANHGEPAKALAELDAMGPIYIESKKYLQGYEHARPYERSFPLIRAQLLTLTGRSEEARSELVRARLLALEEGGFNGGSKRALALLEVARTYLELKQPEAGKIALEALDNAAMATMSDAENNYKGWHRVYPGIVRILAEAGADREAADVAQALAEPYPDRIAQRLVRENGRSRIQGELALQRFRKTDDVGALKPLKDLGPVWRRMSWWLTASEIAKGRQNTDALDFLRSVLTEELRQLETSMAVGMGRAERRIAIHQYARAIRSDTLQLPAELKGTAVTQLSEAARSMGKNDYGWETAKALCELGYTAHRLGHVDEAAKLLNEGTEIAARFISHTFPIDVPPMGACSCWLKAAGRDDRARALLVEAVGRDSSLRMGSGGGLMNFALAASESERGEIDWLDGSRLQP